MYAVPKGCTALLDAIYLGLSKMREAKYGEKALLIISDGGDNHSRYTENEIKSIVKESDVQIYAIGIYDHYFPTDEERLGPQLLSDITELTGGRAFSIDNPNDLSGKYAYGRLHSRQSWHFFIPLLELLWVRPWGDEGNTGGRRLTPKFLLVAVSDAVPDEPGSRVRPLLEPQPDTLG